MLLPSNCSVMGQDLRITSRVDVLLAAPLVSTPTWDPVVFLEGRTVQEIRDSCAHLHSLEIPLVDDIPLMLQQEVREVELREDRLHPACRRRRRSGRPHVLRVSVFPS